MFTAKRIIFGLFHFELEETKWSYFEAIKIEDVMKRVYKSQSIIRVLCDMLLEIIIFYSLKSSSM